MKYITAMKRTSHGLMVSCSPLSICSYMFVNMFVMIVWLVYIIGVDSLETRSSCVWPKDFLSLCIAIRQGGSFIKLCTNTIYSPDPSSLNSLMHQCEVRRSDILIQCGDNGNVEDNCIIDGGKAPIVVPNHDGPLKGVRFHGITFRNASNSLSTLMIENGNEVIFDNCIWQGNTSQDSAIVMVNGGKVTFSNTAFLNNIALNNQQGSAIIANDGAELIFQNSICLQNNMFGGYGMVYIDILSSSSADVTYKCSSNNSIQGNCHYIFSEQYRSCVNFDLTPLTEISTEPSLASSSTTLIPTFRWGPLPSMAPSASATLVLHEAYPTTFPISNFPSKNPGLHVFIPSYAPTHFSTGKIKLESFSPSDSVSFEPSIIQSSESSTAILFESLLPSSVVSTLYSPIKSPPPSEHDYVHLPTLTSYHYRDDSSSPTYEAMRDQVKDTLVPTATLSLVEWNSSDHAFDSKNRTYHFDITMFLLASSACALSLVSIGYILFTKYFIPFFQNSSNLSAT